MDTIQNRMVSTLSVNNIISDNLTLQTRILLEHIPSDGETLQTIIAQNDSYTDFALTLRPTDDFIAHILSCGQWLKVIEPQWLAKEIRQRLQKNLEKYC